MRAEKTFYFVEAFLVLCYDDQENIRRRLYKVNEKKWKTDKVIWIINVVILFCYAMDILGFPNKLAIVWIGLAGLYYIWNKKAINFDLKTLLLVIGMVSYAAIFKYYNKEWSISLILSFGVIPVLFYLIGRQLVGKVREDSAYINKAEILVIMIAFGMFVHALLNYTVWLRQGSGRRWPDFWPDNFAEIATEHSFLSVVMGGLIAYGIYYITKKWYYGIVIIIFATLANYINIKVDNRLVLVTTIAVLGVNFLIFLFLNRANKRMLLYIAVLVCTVLVLGMLFWGFNIGNIRDSIYVQHFLTRDGGILNNIRFRGHAMAASQLFSNWKGGAAMDLGGLDHAHNYWLEMANQAGLVPFIPTVIFTLLSIIDAFRLVIAPEVPERIKYLLPSALVSVFLYFYVEVGGIGTPDYWVFFTVLAGIISQTLKCVKVDTDKRYNERGYNESRNSL